AAAEADLAWRSALLRRYGETAGRAHLRRRPRPVHRAAARDPAPRTRARHLLHGREAAALLAPRGDRGRAPRRAREPHLEPPAHARADADPDPRRALPHAAGDLPADASA